MGMNRSLEPELEQAPLIGIVGGVGPFAGLDLNRKLFEATLTDGTDQEHLEVLLFSAGRRIPDRTEFLLGREPENPAGGLFQALEILARAGVRLAAIACNTAHSPAILGPLKERIAREGLPLVLVDMIEETEKFVRERLGAGARAGLLASQGTYASGVYGRWPGLELILPEEEMRATVHRAIYDREWGIKARSSPVSARARAECLRAVRHLADRGARAVILGCTELPLALPERKLAGVALFDPTETLARALVARAAPDRLRPYA